jgi:MFS family permease
MYLVERVANYLFLDHNPAFYAISGSRIDLFVAIALAGSVAAGALLLDLKVAIATQGSAVVAFFAFAYVFCNPRVCFSAGPDGLEPLRMGIFLGAIAIAGASIGLNTHHRTAKSRGATVAVAFGIFVALAFLPVAYAFAGARLLVPLFPWSMFILFALLSFITAVTACSRLGLLPGFLLPLAATGFMLLLFWSMATAYLPQILLGVGMTVLGALTGSALGALTAHSKKEVVRRHEAGLSRSLLIVLLLVLLLVVVISPDEVSGVLPEPAVGPPTHLAIGIPVYAGGYMDTDAGHSIGVAVTVSFSGTTPASIREDNFLSGGIGVHSPDCCRDGIDYGYRFDVYMFHNGNESLVASAWQICDNNAACGGHSWKNLLFSKIGPLRGGSNATSVTLQMQWEGHSVYWAYQVGTGALVNFAKYLAPAHQDPIFNTGVLSSSFYFFQFGAMSRYPLTNPGWSVTFVCPSIVVAGVWRCVDHARTMEGSVSNWKVLWRWGEDYPRVVVTQSGKYSFTLGYSATSTMESFDVLW